MRIAQVMLARGFGGAERSFVDICRALAGAGHQVLAVCENRARVRAMLTGVPGIDLQAIAVRGSWDPLAGRALARALKGFRPQVVHAHLARAAHIGGRAAAAAGIPSLVKTHNYVNLKYYRHIGHFVTTTADQRDYLLGRGVPSERISVIPNFSSRAAAHEAAAVPAGTPRLLAYGRLVRKKGFHVLLEALSQLAAAGHTLTATIGGDGPELQALQALAAADPAVQVAFPGWLEDVDAALAGHDLFVLPSLDEPFGIVVLEAMAAGLPIVSTNTQGPREILDTGTAALCEPGDANALAQALAGVLADPLAARARAEQALRRYRERYSVAVVLPRYLACYEALATGRQPS